MKAIAKPRPGPGLELVEVPEPELRPGCVKLRIERGSVCGTDLHISRWDRWASDRIKPPRIVGHEFCGTIVEVAEDVSERAVGQFVASESHIVCGRCKQCLTAQGHVCVNTKILGVDVDGGFSPLAVIPWQNARPVPRGASKEVASMLDALGNAVHTVMAGVVERQTVLITGLGPIGLFAVAVCRALGALKVYGTEVSPFRIELARKLGIDEVINPAETNAAEAMRAFEPGGVDVALEMSGHSSSLPLAIGATRPGGRISLLGVFPDSLRDLDVNSIVFKGLELQGIVGRRIWQTWEQMQWLLDERALDVSPVVTHQLPFTSIDEALAILEEGRAGKIVLDFTGNE